MSETQPTSSSPARPGLPRNRFARYPKTTLCLTVLVALGLIELGCYVLILAKGHQDLRYQYPYNRILSGYTVFQNVPHHSFRTSAIKSDPAEPDPVLDEHGFLHDSPVSLQKPAGTFRIFLLGGSTAFGAGQNVRYHSVHPYPDGLYSYPASIAGQLQSYLHSKNPSTKYEVINAAGFERRIHQSFLQYVESLSRYQPDLIINLEGMNDVYSIVTGTPFDDVVQQLPIYVDLYHGQRSLLRYSATYYVLSTAYSKWVNRKRSAEPAPDSGPTTAPPTVKASGQSASDPRPGYTAYEKSKPRYTQNAQRLLQIVRQYFAALSADHTRTIFALQPLLHRLKVNKQLSETERKLAAILVPTAADSKAPVDECGALLSYFYDEYLSGAFRDAARQYGVEYIDLNAEIATLGPNVEFYTDYCHLTPEGNRRVAEILGRAILAGSGTKPRP